ncbi:MAG: T9SS type A sorting domain-containing protein [Bacteroidota bacterium]
MSKTIYTILTGVLGLLMTPNLSAQLATWELTSSETPSLVANNLQASSFTRGNGIGGLEFSADGAVAEGWPKEAQKGVVDYYEICLTPDPGFTFEITGLSFKEKRTTQGIQAYQVFWSTDGFVTAERLDSVAATDADVLRTIEIDNLQESFCDGQPLCIRWYGYNAGSINGQWSIRDIQLDGDIIPFCMPPAIQTRSVAFSNIEGATLDATLDSGSGDRRLVLVRLGEEVSFNPCSGTSYTANSTFGLGDEVAPDTYVVYDGSSLNFSVDGLDAGASYHFLVVEYNSFNFCYLNDEPLKADINTSCSFPVLPQKFMANPTDGKMNLMWDLPSCFDEVLVVASKAPIEGMPAGDGQAYQDDATFGSGGIADASFLGDVFPVYKGTDNRITVDNLADNDIYYFELFVRDGTDWVGPITANSRAIEGCEELGGNDVVFINEIHYLNRGVDQDEGVEIVGPAGVDLSAYSLTLYEYNPSTSYHVEELSGVIDDEIEGNGAIWFPIPDMQNERGAIALYNKVTEEIVQFLGFRGRLTAEDGVAEGLESVLLRDERNFGVAEANNSPVNSSLQLSGEFGCPSNMTWSEAESSRGTLNTTQSILPVELLDFKATLIDEQVLVSWSTLTEINNAFMVVERSNDGTKFQEIGRVDGAGTTNIPQYYQLMDPAPAKGANYYRLRQVDFDGTTAYSPVVVIQVDVEGIGFKVFPTLTADWFTVATNNITQPATLVTIFNALGQQVAQYQIAEENQSLLLNSAGWAPGQYFIHLEVNNETFVERLIKR